ncbi:MAG: TonB-dependent receptor [Flavobacteriales bacterium]
MHKYLFLILSFTLCYNIGFSFDLEGVIQYKGKPVPFSSLEVKDLKLATVSDNDGKFYLKFEKKGTYELLISSIGYKKKKLVVDISDNTSFLVIELKPISYDIEQVVVTGTMKESFVTASPVKVEVLTMKYLEKSPSTNLMDAIENVNGIQQQVNCGVCGTNDIHINGMEGPYTLILIDGMPIMSSLSTVYGLNGIPTSLIKQVEVVKGASSTLYGSEALAGVINVITKDARDVSFLELDIFGTSHLEKNVDFSIVPKLEKSNILFSGNIFSMNNFVDDNNDQFSDVPMSDRYSLFNRWSFNRKNEKLLSFSAKYYNENRKGGVQNYSHDIRGSSLIYGESIFTNRLELMAKYDLPFVNNLNLSMSYNYHHQDSYYGQTNYNASQQVYFSNLVWNKKVSLIHDLLIGYSHRYQTYADSTLALTDEKRFIPGLFIQDDIKLNKRWNFLLGSRVDHHKEHGYIFSPRLNLKYNPSFYTTFRFNSGTGFRIVNLFTEDHAFFGSREVLIAEELNPEKSINFSLNINHFFSFYNSTATLDLDIFHTYFSNKIIPDYDQDPSLIVYENLTGNSISKGISLSLKQNFDFPLNYNLGITFLDVYSVDDDNVKTKQEFAPSFSSVFLLGYKFSNGVSLDWTTRLTGPMSLPTYPFPFERAEQSPTFSLHNVQLKKQVKDNFNIYLGLKNVFNYTQDSPLIDWQNPFGDNFDTNYAYGPLQGRRFFLGLTISLQ